MIMKRELRTPGEPVETGEPKAKLEQERELVHFSNVFFCNCYSFYT